MEREHLIKTVKDKDYDDTVISTYKLINYNFPTYNRKVSSLLDMLRLLFGIDDWANIDSINSQYESYLLDQVIKFKDGGSVDFTEVYNGLLTAYDFVGKERRLFEIGEIDEKLWAIFLSIVSPMINLKINND